MNCRYIKNWMKGKSINVPYPGGLSTDWISSLLIRRVRSPLVMMGFGRLLKKKKKLFQRSAFIALTKCNWTNSKSKDRAQPWSIWQLNNVQEKIRIKYGLQVKLINQLYQILIHYLLVVARSFHSQRFINFAEIYVLFFTREKRIQPFSRLEV